MRAAESFKSNFQKPSSLRLEIKGAKTPPPPPFQDNYRDFGPFVAPSTTGKPENLGNRFSSPRPSPQEKGAKGRRWQTSSAPSAEDVWLLWDLLGPLGSNSLPSGKADPKP